MPFVSELLKYSNDYFIETGTYQGDTLDIIKNSNKFKYLYSIELSDVFYNNCINRFINDNNIKIFKGNSRYDLFKIIFNINTNITFWLDGHWSGVPDVGCDKELLCPVLYELEQIRKHHINTHTIIIDDIRLMDGSHFEVTVEQIKQKILKINPNYKLVFYNDVCAHNDILVAYVDSISTTIIEKKNCIHRYLTECKTNPQPPGLADFIRGTITLFNYSKKYNYNLYIDNSHPVFKNLIKHPHIIKYNNFDTIELLPPLSYEEIDYNLNKLFIESKSFCVMTNAFYNKNEFGILENFGNISLECKFFLREIFTPNKELKDCIINVLNRLNIESNNYNIIHLRLGDNFIHNDFFDKDIFNNLIGHINNIIMNNTINKFILLCDSSIMANKIKEQNPLLYYWDNNKIHIGSLKNKKNIDLAIKDTLIDFFIMSQSKNIYSYAFNGVSGFSKIVSLIYDINYIIF